MNIIACLNNYINGNLSDAKVQAKGISMMSLYKGLLYNFGKSRRAACAIAYYLKHPNQESFDKACKEESEGVK